MQKVLFVASTYSHIRNFHLPYLREFHARGWEVWVACGNTPTEHPDFIDHLISLPFEKKMTSSANFRAASVLRKLYKAEEFDLVVTHTSLAAFFARLALPNVKAKRRNSACLGGDARLGDNGCPRVINMTHGYLYDNATSAAKRSLLRTAERIVARKTDLVLAMNAWDYAEAQRYDLGSEVRMVPGVGVDFARVGGGEYALRAYSGGAGAVSLDAAPRSDDNTANDAPNPAATAPTPQTERSSVAAGNAASATSSPPASQPSPTPLGSSDSFTLFYAAEFSARKSQQTLIRAMQQLPPRVRLVLAGDGALREECIRLAETLGVVDRVEFPGHVENVGEWLAACDAAVSSSRIEGLPFNIMEAMHAGLPVVASDVKGHADLIEHGVTGLLYPYGDAAAFAAQVEALLASPERCRELGDAAHTSVQRYALERVFPQVMGEYERVAETAKR